LEAARRQLDPWGYSPINGGTSVVFERVSPNSNIASYDERYTSGKPTQLSRFDLLAHHVILLVDAGRA
jgi:hypothetical protein